MAKVHTFKFTTRGSLRFDSPYEAIRQAVKKGNLEPKIARSINLMNWLLRDQSIDIEQFVSKAFYHALVMAKGNLKEASMLMTAALRANRSTKNPNFNTQTFMWVQQSNSKSAKFNYANNRDKLWHLFMNAYKRFDGSKSTNLKMAGFIYEIKPTMNPFDKKFLKVKLDSDAKKDIVFNLAGIEFANKIMKNKQAVLDYHTVKIRTELGKELASNKQTKTLYKNMTVSQRKKLVHNLMTTDESIQTKFKINVMSDYSYIAGVLAKMALRAAKKY